MMPPQCCVGVKWRERVRRTRVSSRDIPRPDVRSTAEEAKRDDDAGRGGARRRAAVRLQRRVPLGRQAGGYTGELNAEGSGDAAGRQGSPASLQSRAPCLHSQPTW